MLNVGSGAVGCAGEQAVYLDEHEEDFWMAATHTRHDPTGIQTQRGPTVHVHKSI